MELISNHYLLGEEQYLFRQAAARVAAYRAEHPTGSLINMGIGDVVLPVAPCVAQAMSKAALRQAGEGTLHGYPPTEGYPEVIDAIESYYREMGVDTGSVRFCVGHGAKEELATWNHLFDAAIPAMITTPAYPAYANAAHAVGREIFYLSASAEGLPLPPSKVAGPYLIYLCSPNNPTGQTYSLAQLRQWVDFALRSHSLILFDAAYAAFAYPYSIFMIPESTRCCIEVGTLSKSASFSGIRFGWSAVGKEIQEGALWRAYVKYKSITDNGVGYVVQSGALAALGQEGVRHSRALVAVYKAAAAEIGKSLRDMGITCQVGPYIWLKLPRAFPDDVMGEFLRKGQIIVTDGAGFGVESKGYVRLSVFAVTRCIDEVIKRLHAIFSPYIS